MKTRRSVCQPPPSPPPGGRIGRPRDPALDTAMLDAAMGLLEEVGCAGFTMEGVAARAGVGKQTLYRRWTTRGDLLLDLYYRDATPEDHLDRDYPSLEEMLATLLDLNLKRLYEPSRLHLLRSLAVTAQGDPDLHTVLLARITQPRMRLGRRMLERAIATGQARADLDPDVVLHFLYGGIWFRILFSSEPVTPAFRDGLLAEAIRAVRA